MGREKGSTWGEVWGTALRYIVYKAQKALSGKIGTPDVRPEIPVSPADKKRAEELLRDVPLDKEGDDPLDLHPRIGESLQEEHGVPGGVLYEVSKRHERKTPES